MKNIGIILEILKAMFKQDALWLAIKQVVENRGRIKMMKLELEIEEGAELREIQYNIKEEKARRKLRRQLKKNERNQ